MITTLVQGYTENASAQAVFKKEGELQNLVINNIFDRYANLEGKIGEAALSQYSTQISADEKKKVAAGNLQSILVSVILCILIFTIVILSIPKK